jgi:hypothetical protein
VQILHLFFCLSSLELPDINWDFFSIQSGSSHLLALAAAKLASKKTPKSAESHASPDPADKMTGKQKYRAQRRAKKEKKKQLQTPDGEISAGIAAAFGPAHAAKVGQMTKLWKKSSRRKQKMEEKNGALNGPDLRDHLNGLHTVMNEDLTPVRAKSKKKKAKILDSYIKEQASYTRDQAGFEADHQTFGVKQQQHSNHQFQGENHQQRVKKAKRPRPGQKWRKLEGRINERKNIIIDAYFREQGKARGSKKGFGRKVKQQWQ